MTPRSALAQFLRKPPFGGRSALLPAPPTRGGLGAARAPSGRAPIHEADARLNARPHTTRLTVQHARERGPAGTTNADGASNHHQDRSQ